MSDGVWMSVTDIADARGVTKQAISKRLKALGTRVATRIDGQRVMVNVAEFDRVTGAETDPAQALRNRHQQPAAEQFQDTRPHGQDLAMRVYSQQRAKRESYEAERSRLDLEERLGKLIPATHVEAAMVQCAEALVRVIDQLPSMSDDPVVRKVLKDKARELRETLAHTMRLLPDGDTYP